MKIESLRNRLDLFSYPVYGFNVDGRRNMGSWIGLFCTAVVFTVMMSYSLIKLIHLGDNSMIANSELTGMF